jgi:hypothetical protein
MSDKETKDYKPNEKETRLFEQEKMELYKGTFVVCLVYGFSAFVLLVIILFTEWGKMYIYDKFAPAVITYILGALIIIIYLLNEIFSLKPRKIGADIDSDDNIICPDFWKLEKVKDDIKTEIIKNNVFNNEGVIIPEITREANANIQYRCKADDKVFGNTLEYHKMKDDIVSKTNPYMAGYENRTEAISYNTKKHANNPINVPPDYIVAIPDKQSQNYKDLAKYAKFTGGYNESNADLFSTTSKTLKVASADYLKGSAAATPSTDYTKYKDDNPLICNVVYPQVLGLLDSNTKEKNEVSCDYAKQCGISWSSLKCT